MIAELLRMTHGDEGGWLGSGEDAASSSAVSIAEESLAQVLSSRGGFGLSEIVEKTLDAAPTGKPY
jgi:hypothetical protein